MLGLLEWIRGELVTVFAGRRLTILDIFRIPLFSKLHKFRPTLWLLTLA